jgi:hypothetical protein
MLLVEGASGARAVHPKCEQGPTPVRRRGRAIGSRMAINLLPPTTNGHSRPGSRAGMVQSSAGARVFSMMHAPLRRVAYLFGQAWTHERRIARQTSRSYPPTFSSGLHLAMHAGFLFSRPHWALTGVLTASIEVAATTAMIRFIADAATWLAGNPLVAGRPRLLLAPGGGESDSKWNSHQPRPHPL